MPTSLRIRLICHRSEVPLGMSKNRCANGRRYRGNASAKGHGATSQKREVEWREKVSFSRSSNALGRNRLQFNTALATDQRLLGKFTDAGCGVANYYEDRAVRRLSFFRFDVKISFSYSYVKSPKSALLAIRLSDHFSNSKHLPKFFRPKKFIASNNGAHPK